MKETEPTEPKGQTDREREPGRSTSSESPAPTRLGYLQETYDQWVTLGRPGGKHPISLLERLRRKQTQAAPVPDYGTVDVPFGSFKPGRYQ